MANFTIDNSFVDLVSSSPDIQECKSYDIVLTLSNPVQVNVNYTSCTDGAPSVHNFQVTQAVVSGIETIRWWTFSKSFLHSRFLNMRV